MQLASRVGQKARAPGACQHGNERGLQGPLPLYCHVRRRGLGPLQVCGPDGSEWMHLALNLEARLFLFPGFCIIDF